MQTEIPPNEIKSRSSDSVSVPGAPVYIVYSNWAVRRIYEFLLGKVLESGLVPPEEAQEEIGPLRIVWSRDQETNRTIVVLSEDIFDYLCREGYSKRDYSKEDNSTTEDGSPREDFAISRYEIRDHNRPQPGCNYNLFVPLPKDLDLTQAQVEEEITKRLICLASHRLIPMNSWKITIPLTSRENGKPRGSAFVIFDPEVSHEAIVLAKVVIDDTSWPVPVEEETAESTESGPIFRCFWSRDPKDSKGHRKDRVDAEGFVQPASRKVVKAGVRENRKEKVQELVAKKAPSKSPGETNLPKSTISKNTFDVLAEETED